MDFPFQVADTLRECSAIIDVGFLNISKTSGHKHKCIRECNLLHTKYNWLSFKSFTFYSRTSISFEGLAYEDQRTYNYLSKNGFFTGDYFFQEFKHNHMINATNDCDEFKNQLFDLLRYISLDGKKIKIMHKGGIVEKELLKGKYETFDITDICNIMR